MRKLKSGFTLAEVLITIAVIGIVAAMTLPNMITGYQYKTIGVKLSKFAANTESSARAFVASNGAFGQSTAGQNGGNATNEAARRFGADSFLRVGTASEYALATDAAWAADNSNTALTADNAGIYNLKDGTVVAMMPGAGTLANTVDTGMYGTGAFTLSFDPHVNGLPTSAQKRYKFVVTELGYVFPSTDDPCLVAIAGNDNVYSSRSELYTATTGACHH